VVKPRTQLGRLAGTTSRTIKAIEGVENLDNPRE
jgi:hypothetical protein